jgi:hypothetical protein
MLDGNSAAELRHDTDGVDPTPYLAPALDEVVERVMLGERVPKGRRFSYIDLFDFLQEQPDAHELLAQFISCSAQEASERSSNLDREIERRLRAHLQDSEIVAERAADMARDTEEDAGYDG